MLTFLWRRSYHVAVTEYVTPLKGFGGALCAGVALEKLRELVDHYLE